jgi:hypothetical protein
MPTGREQRFDEFLDRYVATGSTAPLAINVKADGLAAPIRAALESRGIDTFFCFDMSVPDARGYAARGMRFVARAFSSDQGRGDRQAEDRQSAKIDATAGGAVEPERFGGKGFERERNGDD